MSKIETTTTEVTVKSLGKEWYSVELGRQGKIKEILQAITPMIPKFFEGIATSTTEAPQPVSVLKARAQLLGALFSDTPAAGGIIRHCSAFGCLGATLGDVLESYVEKRNTASSKTKKQMAPLTDETLWVSIATHMDGDAQTAGATLRSMVNKLFELVNSMGWRERALNATSGRGKKSSPEETGKVVEGTVVVQPEVTDKDKLIKNVVDLDIPGQLDALKMLIEAMLISGVEHDQIAAVCETTLRNAYEVPAVLAPA